MFREFINFTPSERRAIIPIIVLALFSMIILAIVQVVDGEDENAQISVSSVNKNDTIVVLKDFDPNSVDSVTLVSYGIIPKKVHNLLNYRRHKGIFRRPEDLKKLYTWDEEDYKRVIPFVKIKSGSKTNFNVERNKDYTNYDEGSHRQISNLSGSDTLYEGAKIGGVEKHNRIYSSKFKELTVIDINEADTTQLKQIPGIGSVIASQIVRYRNRLGGYMHVSQVLEVKYVTEDLLQWFKVSENFKVKTLNINKASFVQLISHPYIDKPQTQDILTYRRLYGDIKDKDVLKQTGIFTDSEYEKVIDYLEF